MFLGIHWALILDYDRRTVQPGMAMTVKEMGPVRASSLALISSGCGFLVEFKVGALMATLATAQEYWLLALSGPCNGSEHGAGCTIGARWCLLDLGRAVAH